MVLTFTRGEDLAKYEICSPNFEKNDAISNYIYGVDHIGRFSSSISVAWPQLVACLAFPEEFFFSSKKPHWLGRSNLQIGHYFFPCLLFVL